MKIIKHTKSNEIELVINFEPKLTSNKKLLVHK